MHEFNPLDPDVKRYLDRAADAVTGLPESDPQESEYTKARVGGELVDRLTEGNMSLAQTAIEGHRADIEAALNANRAAYN